MNTIALRNGKPDPALMAALTDPLPQRRGAAAEALCLARIPALRSTLRQLLQDPEPIVRVSVARSLAAVGNKEAVPVLIASLAEGPWEYGAQIEEWLRQLAGDRAPNIYLATGVTARRQCRDAWTAWWQANNVTVDLVKATRHRLLGYTIVACPDTGRVYEVNRHGHIRWQLNELQYPRDVQILSNNHILVAEQNGRRVTERNFKNEILWEKQGDGPVIACQRLPNGHTFIVMSNQLLEVDRRGREVFHYPRPSYDITTARRLLNGQIVFCTTTRECVRLDAKGVEVKKFQLNQAPMSLDVLPNGRILVPIQGTQEVVEYDSNGKVIWKASVPFPVSAVRLPNGHTLVASMNKQTIIELNRNGRVVWEHKMQEHPCSACRR